jgi:hypothetical protein
VDCRITGPNIHGVMARKWTRIAIRPAGLARPCPFSLHRLRRQCHASVCLAPDGVHSIAKPSGPIRSLTILKKPCSAVSITSQPFYQTIIVEVDPARRSHTKRRRDTHFGTLPLP